MNTIFDQKLVEGYHSMSQIARRLTEGWAAENMYCPHCGHDKIIHFPNNRAVADFYCPICKREYELKSKNGTVGRKIADGAYETFVERIGANDNPDFFIMSYNFDEMQVKNLWMIPRHFLTPSLVEKRKPLSENAKRAGWIGCNILFDQIPIQGRIAIVRESCPVGKKTVLNQVQKAEKLRTENLQIRGWLLDVLDCVNQLNKKRFSLSEIYQFENLLQLKHPDNRNIRPKIRQQLQALRDRGILRFAGEGIYQMLEADE